MKVPPLDLPLADVRAELEKLRHPLHIGIIRAKNPFNVGAVIRVAHSFLVKEILLVGDAPFYERAAMGMDRYENIVKVPDEAALVAHAKAADLVLGIPMYGINHSFPLAIAAGIAMAEWTRRFARGTPESGA